MCEAMVAMAMAQTPHPATPPAQLWLKDARQCTPPLPHRMGWPGAIISGVLPDAPHRPPHTARRRRREARQGEIYCMRRKAWTFPQFENGDGIWCSGRGFRQCRNICAMLVKNQAPHPPRMTLNVLRTHWRGHRIGENIPSPEGASDGTNTRR